MTPVVIAFVHRAAHLPRRAALAAAFGWLAACGTGAARDLTMVTLQHSDHDALAQSYVLPFSDAIQAPVITEHWDGKLETLRALIESRNVIWDVVQFDAATLAQACEAQLLAPLDWTRLGGREALIAGAARDCGVATAVTTLGLTFSAKAFGDTGPTGWSDFWDVKRFPGKRGLPLQATQALAIALLADGVPPSDISQTLAQAKETDRALKKLDQIKSQVVWWREPAKALAGLRDGAVVMVAADAASIWDADDGAAANDLRVVAKDALAAFELWGIPRGSLNPDRAYDLLRFMLRPERQAATAARWPRQPTLKAALALLPADAPAFARGAVQGVWIDGARLARDNPELEARFREWVGPQTTDATKKE